MTPARKTRGQAEMNVKSYSDLMRSEKFAKELEQGGEKNSVLI